MSFKKQITMYALSLQTVYALTWMLFWCLFPCCFAAQEINMKITLLWVNKLFATPVQISFSICMILKKGSKSMEERNWFSNPYHISIMETLTLTMCGVYFELPWTNNHQINEVAWQATTGEWSPLLNGLDYNSDSTLLCTVSMTIHDKQTGKI